MENNLPPVITVKNNLASTLKAHIKQNGGKNVSEKQINEILQRVAKFDAERDKGLRAGGSIFEGGSKYFGGSRDDFRIMQGQKIYFSTEEYNAIFEGFIDPIKNSENIKSSLSVAEPEVEAEPVKSQEVPPNTVVLEQPAIKSPLEILGDTSIAERFVPDIPVPVQPQNLSKKFDIQPDIKTIQESNLNILKGQSVVEQNDENFAVHSEEQKEEVPVNNNSYSLGRILTPFSQETINMLYNNTNIHTNFLKNANNWLGTVEYKNQNELTFEEKQRTQSAIIGRYGTPSHQWCAHAVSTIAEQSGINIGGHKSQVQQFINWGKNKGIYNPILNTTPITTSNFEAVREARANDISKQILDMKEGDLIVWKSRYAAKTNEGLNFWNASHIGIIESVDLAHGSVTVLEGNANVPKSDNTYERYIVRNASQRLIGDQVNGEPQELNRTDGFIRKVYTIQDLANFGYSGYINMQSLV